MKKIFLLVVLCTSGIVLRAQQTPPDFKITPPSDYLPQTPTAASLGQYVDQKVDMHTGIPEISIPLYTINTGDYQLPITLSYHAGGHQVSSAGSWVGLGWSLSAGGSINRTIRSLEDKDAAHPDSYITLKNRPQGLILSADVAADYTVLSKISNNIVDAAPDLYSFNIPGASGKFLMLESGAMLTPAQPIKVSGTISNPLTFTLRDDKGVTYDFWDAEEAHSKSGGTGIATRRKTAFMLSRILTPRLRPISFAYMDTEFSQDFGITYMMEYIQQSGGGGFTSLWNNPKPVGTNTQSFGKTLTDITWDGGEAIFVTSAREDVPGDRKLDGLYIYNKNRLVKKYLFTYAYFNQNDLLAKRLKLVSLTEVNLDGSGKDIVQQFIYNEGVNLPARNSFAYDHWGYYNNAGQPLTILNSDGTVNVDNKAPDLAYAKANILTDIIHPTKGRTTFEYELNQYFSSTTEYREHTFSCLAINDAFQDIRLFNVPSGSENVKITLKPSVIANYGTYNNNYVEVKWSSFGDDVMAKYRQSDNGTTKTLTNLPASPYTITCNIDNNKNYAQATEGKLSYNLVTAGGEPGGGLRVKRIIKTALDGSPPLVTNYSYTNAEGKSSGVLMKAKPVYLRYTTGYTPGSGGAYCASNTQTNAIIYTGMSPVDFATSPVVYTQVTVSQGNNGENGKTVHTFTVGSSGPNDGSWVSGKPLLENTYNANNVLLSSVENVYEMINDPVPAITAVNAEQLSGHQCSQDYVYNSSYPRHYEITYSSHFQGWMRHDRTIVKTFHPDGGIPQTSTVKTFDYGYDAYHQISNITEDAGNNQKLITQFTYPQNTAGSIYQQMVSANRVGELISKATILQNGTDVHNGKIISKAYVKYANVVVGSNNVPMLESQYALETTTPLGITTSVPESPCVGPPCFEKQISLQYSTPSLDPVLVTDKTNQKFAMVWGKNHDLIAQAVNASAEQVAYTSFEQAGSSQVLGNWTILVPMAGDVDVSSFPPAKTGKFCVTQTKMGKTGLPAGQYILAYTVHGSGTIDVNGTTSSVNESNWKYVATTITTGGPSDVIYIQPNVGVFIDELRLYPVGATMKTFVHESMVGVRAIADENGNTNHFNYDGLNRLLYITDDKSSVVQTFEYNLKK